MRRAALCPQAILATTIGALPTLKRYFQLFYDRLFKIFIIGFEIGDMHKLFV